jgi:Zn-dependent M28 family amino/carboxypeptidase
MIFFRWLIVLLLFVIVSFYALSQSAVEKKYISRVSQQRLQQNVRDLVKIGHRMGGTKSGDNSSRYVYNAFRTYGYKPDLIKDQEKLTFSAERWSLQIEQPKRLRGLIQHEWLANYSPSVKRDTAQLVFIKSIKDADKTLIDSGIVLLENPPTEELYEALVEAGTRCIVCYVASHSNAYSNWAMIYSLKERKDNPIPVFTISNIAGKRIRAELDKDTRIVMRFFARTKIKLAKPKTVIATLNGSTDEYYLVCAHGDSDSGGPGADDNASGVSGLLEIARNLKHLVDNKTLPIPRCSIRFVAWGSETFSTKNYIKKNEKELNKIRGVINIDEIGSGKTRSCIYFEGNDIPQNQDLLRVFEKIGEEYVDKYGFWKEATTNPAQGGTDSYIFLPQSLDRLDVPEIKIPSITVFTTAWNEPKAMQQTHGWISKAWKGHPDSVNIDYSPYYHSSLDIPAFTTDKEPSRMVWAVNAVGISLIRLIWN